MKFSTVTLVIIVLWSSGSFYREGVAQMTRRTCPPAWIRLVEQFRGRLLKTDPACKFRTLFNKCNPDATNPCKPGDPNYTCCPITDLTAVQDCFPGNPRGLCVAHNISAFLPLILRTLGLGL